jgi:adenosyl cobinamide kinase/adenosyl cobinamide phosphate guanylyltransferase
MASEREEPVTFVATLIPGDEAEMRERVKRHQADRPADWETVEEERDLAHVFGETIRTGTVIVDCLTLYVSNLLLDGRSDEEILRNVARACEQMKRSHAEIIVVTNEVGWGIVPDHAMGRRFRDVAGLVNQKVAEAAGSSPNKFQRVQRLPRLPKLGRVDSRFTFYVSRFTATQNLFKN